MNSEICEKCRESGKCECDYIEVEEFVKYWNKKHDAQYKRIDCPDKSGQSYTCDLVLEDQTSKSKLYLEVKEVRHAYKKGKNKNSSLGEENGQQTYADIFSRVLAGLTEQKRKSLDQYMVLFSKAQIYESEMESFEKELAKFLNSKVFDEEHHRFTFERQKGNDLVIEIVKKQNETVEKFGSHILYAYNENIIVSDLLDRVNNIDELVRLLKHNAENTDDKKFPKTNENDKKILINILKLPIGYDLFFNLNIKGLVADLISKSDEISSAADEIYLVYYCEDFYKLTDSAVQSKGRVVFIIALNSSINYFAEILLNE